MRPEVLAITALIIKLLVPYLLIGGIAVVGTTYVSALLGGNWFNHGSSKRWDNSSDFPNAALVFFAWPIIGPIALLCFLGRGFMKAVEAGADKAEALGTRRERALRGIKATTVLFPLLLSLMACGGGHRLPKEAPVTALGAKRTVQLVELTQSQWLRAGYQLYDDFILDYPVRLAIAGDNTACIITANEAALWRSGYVIQCNNWRVHHASR
jgi:H+/Cl- antiporter ClcA